MPRGVTALAAGRKPSRPRWIQGSRAPTGAAPARVARLFLLSEAMSGGKMNSKIALNRRTRPRATAESAPARIARHRWVACRKLPSPRRRRPPFSIKSHLLRALPCSARLFPPSASVCSGPSQPSRASASLLLSPHRSGGRPSKLPRCDAASGRRSSRRNARRRESAGSLLVSPCRAGCGGEHYGRPHAP